MAEKIRSLEKSLRPVKPERLREGDTVMVISPAAGLAGLFRHRAENGIKALERLGFNVVEGSNARIVGARAGSAKERVADIHAGATDPQVKAIFAMIGGNNVCPEILPYLDLDAIKNNTKIFIGYSDVTALLLAIYKQTGLTTFYGPTVMNQFAEYPQVPDYTLHYLNRALMSGEPIGQIRPPGVYTDEFLDWEQQLDLTKARTISPGGWEWLREGQTTGPLIGGCLESLKFLVQNFPSYLPDLRGAIFFWESAEKELNTGHPPDEIIASLEVLIKIGILEGIRGMIIGRPYQYNPAWHEHLKIKIREIVDPNIPILYNAPIGHTDPMITLPIGAKTTLDSNSNLFSIDEAGVI